MIIISHPTGNANVRAVAKSLNSEGLLSEFHTTIASYPGNIWNVLGGIKPLSEFRRRSFDSSLKPFTYLHPYRELGRLFAKKVKWDGLLKHETGIFSIDQIYRSLDHYVAASLKDAVKNNVNAVYAYEDGSLETFKKAKQLGLKCIYDLPIAYYETGRRLMQQEAERLPEWAITLGGGIKDSEEKLLRKKQELELADVVVGPGSFVLDSLPVWAKNKKLIMSPFGSPMLAKHTEINKSYDTTKPLRVLFVGSMGQRKGLADLFAAAKLLKDSNVEIVVLGSLLAPLEFYRSQYNDFTYEPGRSHDKVLELMRSCDVFCLPSIVEGRALVMQEAMSQGLPIIITSNTGGEDLVKEGETGFLVPLSAPESIAEKINWFCENRNQIPEMSKKAVKLSQTYTWDNYGKKIVEELNFLK